VLGLAVAPSDGAGAAPSGDALTARARGSCFALVGGRDGTAERTASVWEVGASGAVVRSALGARMAEVSRAASRCEAGGARAFRPPGRGMTNPAALLWTTPLARAGTCDL
jgi:hypothetical protein